MGCEWVVCKNGNHFVLTEGGFENARIRAKFDFDNPNNKLYKHKVPKSWVSKGYVLEVKEV